jgi:2-polyprenyl-3-methyl-5-hydroxy-6-metoxy-1,4-benzoquinol methylase
MGDGRKLWEEAKGSVVGDDTLTLGPYFSKQVKDQTRHLLFVLARYKFAARLLPEARPLKVLELGCSEGLGALMLIERGHALTAIDFDAAAIESAKRTFGDTGIDWRCEDFLGKTYGVYDAVVSIDVIEHINRAHEDRYMATVAGNLHEHGFAVIGTPNDSASEYASEASRIGHINMFSHDRLSALMNRYFHQSFLFGVNDEVVHTGFYPMSHYLMALGCSPRTTPLLEAENDG